MSPKIPTPVQTGNIWTRAAEWLLRQETSTVLLVAIFSLLAVGVFYGCPWVASEMKTYVKEMNQSHEVQVQRVTEAFDKAHERDNVIIRDLMRSRGLNTEGVPPARPMLGPALSANGSK